MFVALFFSGCATGNKPRPDVAIQKETVVDLSPVEKIPADQRNAYDLTVMGARREAEKGVTYEASYVQINYPGGDVPSDRGVCTDVVIRAFRNAGIDLQKLIHEDMKAHFGLYPQNWGLKGPDSNIDHRRVPNQMKFFERHGKTLTLSTAEQELSQWRWGDIVYWKFSNGLEHCGIVSDRVGERGLPLAIHNAGLALEEDCLDRWRIIGHYRYPY
ncbi:periplasmic protein [Desulfocucumis palustris]|uniref:Periplasmic protein n=1 Tax=Desulfocucumis palustris TaxID=1898651 RepID=A0A2L2XDR5_9FIRM|nr:periplasmic protein [Desulfocucumis palustris]